MSRSARTVFCIFVAVTTSALACSTPTEPLAPFGVWSLQRINGRDLPFPITVSGSTFYIVADTLDLRAAPITGVGSGSIVFITRNSSGQLARNQAALGYVIQSGQIAIDFHCLFPCFTVYAPLTAELDGNELFFRDRVEFESRLYRRVH